MRFRTVRRLIAPFEEQREAYLHPSYKEAQLRKEFIAPMWKALGWDMGNSQGHAEQYKERFKWKHYLSDMTGVPRTQS